MTDLLTAPTDVPAFRLTGACACCGAPTAKLFAMGHDARFRGQLQRALASDQGWYTVVSWYTSPSASVEVTVPVALAGVRALLGKDWTERVTAGASRLSRRPRTAPPPDLEVASARPGAFVPQELIDARVASLCERLAAHPKTGEWGWLRGINDLTAPRTPARVQKTRRDSEESSLIDLWVPELGHVLERVDPALWTRDESAKV